MKEPIQRLREHADDAEAMRDTYPECDDDWEDLRRDLELTADALAYAEKRLSDLQGAYADANAEIERLRRNARAGREGTGCTDNCYQCQCPDGPGREGGE
jgi:chromosome segregation ATPase